MRTLFDMDEGGEAGGEDAVVGVDMDAVAGELNRGQSGGALLN